ncbi:MAG: hypothetical protein P4N59_16880 [Negativicutes bacterium]|nr:hypothetical protein [Negativicutes bacterium]
MGQANVEELRKANAVPFRVVDWLEQLTPVVVHDEWGTMYKGRILAQDSYGTFAAIVGTTDRLLNTHAATPSEQSPYRILKIDGKVLAFSK